MMKISDENQLSVVSLAIAYGIAISLLYLFGYWSTFNINVLDYASLSDVVKIAIYPVFVSAVLVIIAPLVFGFVSGRLLEKDPGKAFIIVSHRYTRWSTLVAIVIGIILIAWQRNGTAFKYAGICLTYAININIPTNHRFLKPLIPNEVVRRIIIFILLMVLLCSFGSGRENGEKVLGGKGVSVVSTAIFKAKGTEEFRSKALLEKQDSLKYLGAAGDYFLFMTLDNSEIIIAKYNDLHFLNFKK